jgi:outer membrane protein OmpA-like peptidoglycan-associated protein
MVGATLSLTGGLADLAYINVSLVPRMIKAKQAPALEEAPRAPLEEPRAPEPIEAQPVEVVADVIEAPVEVVYELAAVVRFKTSSDRLTRAASAELDRLAKRVLSDPALRVRTYGHADHRGPSPFNQSLSERRASAVARELERLGVQGDRIDVRGFGELMSSERWFLDRRVEISIGKRSAQRAERAESGARALPERDPKGRRSERGGPKG